MFRNMLPAITDNLDQAKLDIRETGLALISGQLSDSMLTRARDLTYGAAAEDKRLGRQPNSFGLDYGDGNVRVWNILNRDSLFRDMVQSPVVLDLLECVIGWPALLGNISANITTPDSDGGAWHQDQLFVPKPWPANPQGMNFAWLLDDFTEANGATEVISGSHLNDFPEPDPDDSRAIPVVAPAGTLMVFESRLWHRTGCNHSSSPRAGLFGWYTRTIYRTQENWFLSLDDGVLDEASDELLLLLGYRTQGLGLVYGRSPR